MTMTSHVSAAPEAESGQNPLVPLGQLANVIAGIDSFLARPDQATLAVELRHRLLYLRNTLAVGFNLWQLDACRRVSRSQGAFYIFCMTEGERLGFLRRMVPGLVFAAEELRGLNLKGVAHLVDLVSQLSLAAENYANNNKLCLRRALADGGTIPWREFQPRPLPRLESTPA